MIVIMSFMLVVHVPIVQIVDMAFVLNSGMAATGAMDMVMLTVVMFVLFGHRFSPGCITPVFRNSYAGWLKKNRPLQRRSVNE